MNEGFAYVGSIQGTKLWFLFREEDRKSVEFDVSKLTLPQSFVQKNAERDPHYDWAWQLYCRWVYVSWDAETLDFVAVRLADEREILLLESERRSAV